MQKIYRALVHIYGHKLASIVYPWYRNMFVNCIQVEIIKYLVHPAGHIFTAVSLRGKAGALKFCEYYKSYPQYIGYYDFDHIWPDFNNFSVQEIYL